LIFPPELTCVVRKKIAREGDRIAEQKELRKVVGSKRRGGDRGRRTKKC